MIKNFADLPDWIFDMNEVSAGVYEVVAKDSMEHIVSAKGFDLDLVIEQCRTKARDVSNRNPMKTS
jgi:hypothetical protein